MNSNVTCNDGTPYCDSGGWMHLLDIGSAGFCNGPYPGTRGPSMKYSRSVGKTVLMAYTNGMYVCTHARTLTYVVRMYECLFIYFFILVCMCMCVCRYTFYSRFRGWLHLLSIGETSSAIQNGSNPGKGVKLLLYIVVSRQHQLVFDYMYVIIHNVHNTSTTTYVCIFRAHMCVCRVRLDISIIVNLKMHIHVFIYSQQACLLITDLWNCDTAKHLLWQNTLVLISMHDKPAEKMFSMFKAVAVGVVSVGGLQTGQCFRPFFTDLVVKVIVRGAMNGHLGVWQTHVGCPSFIGAWYCIMMASSNGHISALLALCEGNPPVTGYLTQASDAELRCFLWSAPEQMVEQRIQTKVICDASSSLWHHFCVCMYACMCSLHIWQQIDVAKKQCFSWGTPDEDWHQHADTTSHVVNYSKGDS